MFDHDRIADILGFRFLHELWEETEQPLIPNHRNEVRTVLYKVSAWILYIVTRDIHLHFFPRIPVFLRCLKVSVIEKVWSIPGPGEDVQFDRHFVAVLTDLLLKKQPHHLQIGYLVYFK